MARRTITTLLVTIAAAAALAAGCGDGDDGGGGATATAVVPTPEATATPLPDEPLPTAGLTGIPELDAVIDAIRSGDGQAIGDRIKYTTYE